MEFKDYYKNLGVDRSATQETIKSTYRKLARKFHPDLNPGNKRAEERFKEINEAYDVLGEEEKRKKYDQLGANWEQILRDQQYGNVYTDFGGFGGREGRKTGGFSDFFDAFFGGNPLGSEGFGGETLKPQAGEDTEYGFPLTLEEIVKGEKKALKISLGEICSRCKGAGKISTTTSSQNRRRVTMHICPNCRGTGQTERSQTIEVKIPKGLKEGFKIRLAGLGGGVQGGKPGDLYLRVRIVPHRIFRAEGHNLYAELPVWDDEAALGTEMTVPTLVGNVVLHIPPGTQNGHQLRLKGKGLSMAKGEGFGDLYWKVLVVGAPPHLSEKERELYLELRRHRVGKSHREDIRKRIKP